MEIVEDRRLVSGVVRNASLKQKSSTFETTRRIIMAKKRTTARKTARKSKRTTAKKARRPAARRSRKAARK